nr:MRN complex-interacting protein [Tanacetum cinerariifolium]
MDCAIFLGCVVAMFRVIIGDLCEPNVVTELPKPLFKKPKLRDDYSAAGLDCEDGAKLRRPVFGKRNVKKKVDNPDLKVMMDFDIRHAHNDSIHYSRRLGGENQLNHNYADKEIGVSSKWGEYNKIQHKDNVDHSFAYKATSSIMSKFKRPACEIVNHGFTNIGSSSVMTKLKRPASKWDDFLDDDNDLELKMSRCEEVNNAAFERKFPLFLHCLGDEEVEVGRRSAKKHTDWTEYIDHDEVHNDNDEDKEPRTTGKENFKRGGKNQLNHDYTDKEMGISSKWGEYNKIQHKDIVNHSFAYKATSSIIDAKLKRPASKWNDFLDDDNDLEFEMSRCEEVNNAAFVRKVSDEIVEDDIHPDFL